MVSHYVCGGPSPALCEYNERAEAVPTPARKKNRRFGWLSAEGDDLGTATVRRVATLLVIARHRVRSVSHDELPGAVGLAAQHLDGLEPRFDLLARAIDGCAFEVGVQLRDVADNVR